MSFTISFPFLYQLPGGEGGSIPGAEVGRAKAVTSHTQRQNSRRGGCLIAGEEQVERMRENEVKVASRRVSIAGEQFLCGGRAVPY